MKNMGNAQFRHEQITEFMRTKGKWFLPSGDAPNRKERRQVLQKRKIGSDIPQFIMCYLDKKGDYIPYDKLEAARAKKLIKRTYLKRIIKPRTQYDS